MHASTELNLHARRISSIREAFLQKYPSLQSLDLSCNCITKIEGLDILPKLKELKLYSNSIKAINGLEKLGQLSILLLHDNQISVIGSGLLEQKKLQVLRLDHNKVEEVSWGEIGNCRHLLQLDLSSNCLRLLKGSCDLEQLEELKLANNQITTVPNLAGCKMLREVDLSGNPLCIDSLSALAVLKNLKILSINAVGLSDFGQLPVLRELEELHAAGNSCKSLQALPHHCSHLEVLDVRTNGITTLEQLAPLCQMADLNELLLEGNPVCLSCSRGELATFLPQVEVLISDRPTAASFDVPSSVKEDNHTWSLGMLLTQAELDLKKSQEDIIARFELLRGSPDPEHAGSPFDLVASVPQPEDASVESHSETVQDKPPSRCGSRARLREALVYANTSKQIH